MTSSPNPFDAPRVDIDPFPYDPEVLDDAPLAGRGTRLLAMIVDGLLLVASALPTVLFLVLEQEEIALGVGAIGVLALTGYQWYLIATSGQTLAKRWLNIRIVREDGSDVDFVTGVIMRNWVVRALGGLPFVGVVVPFVDALMIFGETQQCLHDRIAKTKVIQVTY